MRKNADETMAKCSANGKDADDMAIQRGQVKNKHTGDQTQTAEMNQNNHKSSWRQRKGLGKNMT